MKKIQSLFMRNYDGDRLVRDEVVPGSEWVLDGEGIATIKYDGTSCMVQNGKIYRRYDAKEGKTPPPGFIPAQDADPVTGHWPGWVECDRNKSEDKWHFEAFDREEGKFKDGTYELCGPKINGNKEFLSHHALIKHGECRLIGGVGRSFQDIKEFLIAHNIEGIVWHNHHDGRMVKIKRKDFGLPWNGKR